MNECEQNTNGHNRIRKAAFPCPTCGVLTTVELDECGPDESHLELCQGVDDCMTNGQKTRCCQNCRWKCWTCDLWACEHHIGTDPDGHRECHICRKARIEESLECDPPCLCVFAGDTADASDCPVHGPASPVADARRAREAQQEASYWQGGMPAQEGEPF